MMTFTSTLKMSEHFATKLGGRWQVQNDLVDGMLFVDQEPELFSYILRLLRALARGGTLQNMDLPLVLHHRRALFLEMCRYYLIEVPKTPRMDTGMLDARHEELLRPLIEKLTLKVPKLLFRATRDGFSASRFHALCDNKGPTLVLIAHSHFDMLLGGVTEAQWSSTTVVKDSKHAKLFQMSQSQDGKQVLLQLREHVNFGIACHKEWGPCFVSGTEQRKELSLVFDGAERASVEDPRSAKQTPWEYFEASVLDIEVFAL